MGLLDKVQAVVTRGDQLVLASKAPVSPNDFLKEEPPSVVQVIDDVLDSGRIRRNFFRPSGFYGCKRQNVFHYIDAPAGPQQVGNKLQRILDNGTAVHSVVQEYISKHPDFWFAPESKVEINLDGAWIRGSCDGILIRKSDQYRFGLEIKTINEKDFKSLSKPKEDHVRQASIYAVLSGVWWITILYWNKNNQDLKEFHVPFDENRWNEVRERVRELKSYVDKKQLPVFDAAECDQTFCRYVDVCRKNGGLV